MRNTDIKVFPNPSNGTINLKMSKGIQNVFVIICYYLRLFHQNPQPVTGITLSKPVIPNLGVRVSIC